MHKKDISQISEKYSILKFKKKYDYLKFVSNTTKKRGNQNCVWYKFLDNHIF